MQQLPLRGFALWLGVCALLLQNLAPFAMSAAASPGLALVICTVHGRETVHIGADGIILSGQSEPRNGGLACSVCSDCTSAAAFPVPFPVFVSELLALFRERQITADPLFWAPRDHITYTSRAPPQVG
jgi:hypothetical protein